LRSAMIAAAFEPGRDGAAAGADLADLVIAAALDLILGVLAMRATPILGAGPMPALAPPKAPQIARRGLTLAGSSQARRPTATAMLPVRKKSSRIHALHGAFLEASRPVAGLHGCPATQQADPDEPGCEDRPRSSDGRGLDLGAGRRASLPEAAITSSHAHTRSYA
jgi:hypothetical protein